MSSLLSRWHDVESNISTFLGCPRLPQCQCSSTCQCRPCPTQTVTVLCLSCILGSWSRESPTTTIMIIDLASVVSASVVSAFIILASVFSAPSIQLHDFSSRLMSHDLVIQAGDQSTAAIPNKLSSCQAVKLMPHSPSSLVYHCTTSCCCMLYVGVVGQGWSLFVVRCLLFEIESL